MFNITDPVTRAALAVLVSVLAGTCLLILVAVFRRGMQIRFSRYVHYLRKQYRPILAKVLSTTRDTTGIEALRSLPLNDLELLLDPVFSKRKLPERCLGSLQSLCAELGLIKLWESRVANGHAVHPPRPRFDSGGMHADHPSLRHLLRAKSIRNLGTLRHRPSWPLLNMALDDRKVDIQMVALRSLAEMGAPESFPVLGDRLQSVVQGTASSPPLQGLRAAMVRFDHSCAPALMPSLLHPHRNVRYYAAEILRTMVYRHAAQDSAFALTPQIITPAMVEVILTLLPQDPNSDVRARAAEVMVFLGDTRTAPVLQTLLRDPQWFVRMRAVRALARPGIPATLPQAAICECLRDPHWRVREAAIQTLLSSGQEGTHEVFRQFLQSPDGEMREQILEIVQRAGLARDLADAYEAEGSSDGVAPSEPLAGAGAGKAIPADLPKPRTAARAEFLHRVVPGLDPGNSTSNARGQKPKGAYRRQPQNDGPRYPSV